MMGRPNQQSLKSSELVLKGIMRMNESHGSFKNSKLKIMEESESDIVVSGFEHRQKVQKQ
jgi:hypothetical protein